MFALRFAAVAALGLASIAPAAALTFIAGNGGNGTGTIAPEIDRTVAITGGNTAVRVTANLTALNLTASLLGTANAQSNNRVFFPITGGDLNPATLAGFILHNGSGLRLARGSTTIDARNFTIDTLTGRLLGDVTIGGTTSNVQLFSFSLAGLTPAQITDLANPQISLRITSAFAGALTSVFGAPNLTGIEFGVAATAPQLQQQAAVPEPSTWAMLILGFGVIGAGLRTRRTKVSFG